MIPSTIKGIPVTKIGYTAFAKCENVTNITIPYGVKIIGKSAFLQCYNLEQITFPETLTDINEWAFQECKKLQKIKFPKSLKTIDRQAFALCDGLKDVTIWNDGITIGINAFYRCVNLEKVYIYADNINLDNASFAECDNLKHVYITKNINSMGESVFASTKSKDYDINFYVASKNTKNVLRNNGIRNGRIMLDGIVPPSDWKHDSQGWWYSEGNSWAIGWRKIEGKFYYFNEDGYMAHDCVRDSYVSTIDDNYVHYKLNSDGQIESAQWAYSVMASIPYPTPENPEYNYTIDWSSAPYSINRYE